MTERHYYVQHDAKGGWYTHATCYSRAHARSRMADALARNAQGCMFKRSVNWRIVEVTVMENTIERGRG